MRCTSHYHRYAHATPTLRLLFWECCFEKASPGRGSTPLNSLRHHLASCCKQSGQHDQHQAPRLTGGLPWAPKRTNRRSSAFVKSTILPAGSACTLWPWPARQQQRQCTGWGLAAASVRSGSLRVECNTTRQAHYQRNETARTAAGGSARLVHHSNMDEATQRGDATKAMPKVDTRSYNSSAIATWGGSSGGGPDEIGDLEPLVQQMATTLDQRCGVRGGDQVDFQNYTFTTVREYWC